MKDLESTQNLRDEVIVCCDCGESFTFTSGEKKFYLSKNLTIPPRRCATCRRLRRATINPDSRQYGHTDDTLAQAQEEIGRWRHTDNGHQGVS